MWIAIIVSLQLLISVGGSNHHNCPRLQSNLHCRCLTTPDNNIEMTCNIGNVSELISLADYRYASLLTSLNIGLFNITTFPSSVLPFNNLIRLTIAGMISSIDEHAFTDLKESLCHLHVHNSALNKVPVSAVINLTKIQTLTLESNQITALNVSLRELPLKDLVLYNNSIFVITPGIFPATLNSLNLMNNRLCSLNSSLGNNLIRLTKLFISYNFISSLHQELEWLPKLVQLEANRNFIESIDGAEPPLGRLSQLKILKLSYNRIYRIVDGLRGLRQLEELDLSHNSLIYVDKMALSDLGALQKLFLNHNRITNLTEGSLDCLSSLQNLDISNNNLIELHFLNIPQEFTVTDQYMDTLQEASGICSFRNYSKFENLIMIESGVTCDDENVNQTIVYLQSKNVTVEGNPCTMRK